MNRHYFHLKNYGVTHTTYPGGRGDEKNKKKGRFSAHVLYCLDLDATGVQKCLSPPLRSTGLLELPTVVCSTLSEQLHVWSIFHAICKSCRTKSSHIHFHRQPQRRQGLVVRRISRTDPLNVAMNHQECTGTQHSRNTYAFADVITQFSRIEITNLKRMFVKTSPRSPVSVTAGFCSIPPVRGNLLPPGTPRNR